MIPLLGVNLIAFEMRFVSICVILVGSPRMLIGIFGSIQIFNSISFSRALATKLSIASSNFLIGSKSIFSKFIFPALILEKSRISLTICIKLSELFSIISIISSCSSESFVSCNSFVNPIIPFNGVRIS